MAYDDGCKVTPCAKHGEMPGSYCVLCAGASQAQIDKYGRTRFLMRRKDGAICFGSDAPQAIQVAMRGRHGGIHGGAGSYREEPIDPDSVDWSAWT